MHICFPFIGDSLGGSYISSMLLSNGLINKGYKVTIVVHEDGPIRDELEATNTNYRVVRLPTYLGQQAGIVNYCGAFYCSLGPIGSFLKQEKVDLVHTNDMRTHLTWSVPATVRKRITIWHQRTLFAPSRLPELLIKTADRIVVISDAVARTIPKRCEKSPPVVVVPNPVSTDSPEVSVVKKIRVMVQKQANLQNEDRFFLIGWFSALRALKDPFLFVKLIAALNKISPYPVVAIMLGKDLEGLKDKISAQICCSDMGNRIFLMGFQRPIESWMSACDLLVAPSTGDAFGRTLIEAMSLGVPVVAAAAGGHVEVIQHRINGLLATAGNLEEFSYCVNEVMNDDSFRHQLVREGRATVRQRYGLRDHVERIASVYEDVVKERMG